MAGEEPFDRSREQWFTGFCADVACCSLIRGRSLDGAPAYWWHDIKVLDNDHDADPGDRKEPSMAFDMIEPLPAPSSEPVTYSRIQKTPCTTRELMATLLKTVEEAGTNEITINATRNGITGPTVEFIWKEAR